MAPRPIKEESVQPWTKEDQTLLITQEDKKDAGIYGSRRIIRYNKVRESAAKAIRVFMCENGVDSKHWRNL